MVEVSSSGVRIGVRVTNDLGDSSPPLVAFQGWTFDNGELALPIGTVISETPSQHGLNRTKYSGNFVLDPTWFAANTGNIVNGDSFPEGILQNYDEVSGAFSFQYFGYFVPPTSANYTFRAHADETFVFWIGSKALLGYTYANKDMYGDYNGTFPEQQTQSFTIALTAGEFYPIRIQWANSGGIGQLDVFTWANDSGQADTADFTGRVFRENTGTAKIAVNDNRSIILSTDNETDNNWTFAPNGSLTFPDATVQTTAWTGITNALRSEGNINIEVNLSDSTLRRWQFGEDGDTVFPNNVSINYGGGNNVLYPRIIADSGKLFSVQGQGSTGSAALAWSVDPDADTKYAAVGVNQGGGDNLAKVVLTAGNTTATLKVWKFDETGALTFPDGTIQTTAPAFSFSVAADDSTQRAISNNESIKFIGAGGVTTASDAEGNITITGGGGGLSSRTSVSGTTASLADAATGNLTITGFKGYFLYKIQTSAAAWVRIYTDSASRTSDAGRSELTDPTPGSGVIAEVITTGAQTILISPGAMGFSNETSPSTNIELAVTNKSGGATTVSVTLTILQIEA